MISPGSADRLLPSLTVNFGFMNSRSNCLELKCMSSGSRCSSRTSGSSFGALGFRPFLPLGGVAARALLPPEAGNVIAVFDGAKRSFTDGVSAFSKSMRNGVFSFRANLATTASSVGSTGAVLVMYRHMYNEEKQHTSSDSSSQLPVLRSSPILEESLIEII